MTDWCLAAAFARPLASMRYGLLFVNDNTDNSMAITDEFKLKRQQIRLFSLLFCGYTFYILARQSLSYNIPNIKIYENVDSEQIGTLTSALALGYAIGKFLSGILVDFASPKQLFSLGLCVCGIINIVFSFTKSIRILGLLWLANGLFQGFGWPSCAKLLRSWYEPGKFGTLWSLLSASMNVGASVGPILSNSLMDVFGSWRISMRIFGIIAFIFSIICWMLIHDSPGECGLKMKSSDAAGHPSQEIANPPTPSLANALKRIFRSPVVYIMSLGFLACLFCKGIMTDWGPLYLITEKHATRQMASSFITAFQAGGISGNISSGMITDWIKSKSSIKRKGHPRNLLLIPLVALLALCVAVLCNYIDDMNRQYYAVLVLSFVIGHALYSLISIVGVTVVEISSSDLSGTSHAVAALFGNIGLILSGLPFTLIVGNYSWDTAFSCLEGVLIIWFLLALCSQFLECRIGVIKRKLN